MESIKKHKTILRGKITRIKNINSETVDKMIIPKELEIYNGHVHDTASELNKIH